MEEIKFKWFENLVKSVGRDVIIETLDGITRKGVLSKVKTREFLYNGVTVSEPVELNLNGDVNDIVTVNRIESIKVF